MFCVCAQVIEDRKGRGVSWGWGFQEHQAQQALKVFTSFQNPHLSGRVRLHEATGDQRRLMTVLPGLFAWCYHTLQKNRYQERFMSAVSHLNKRITKRAGKRLSFLLGGYKVRAGSLLPQVKKPVVIFCFCIVSA